MKNPTFHSFEKPDDLATLSSFSSAGSNPPECLTGHAPHPRYRLLPFHPSPLHSLPYCLTPSTFELGTPLQIQPSLWKG